jgi:hypothetical protein
LETSVESAWEHKILYKRVVENENNYEMWFKRIYISQRRRRTNGGSRVIKHYFKQYKGRVPSFSAGLSRCSTSQPRCLLLVHAESSVNLFAARANGEVLKFNESRLLALRLCSVPDRKYYLFPRLNTLLTEAVCSSTSAKHVS